MMLLAFSLIFTAFSVVLADRRREDRHSRLNRLEQSADVSSGNIQYTTNWAGSALEKDGETISFVTGTFAVPVYVPEGLPNATATAWVGIDGAGTCNGTGLLQGGVDLSPDAEGGVACAAWYEWYPDYSYYFANLTVFAGHVIRVNITALSTTVGRVTIENLSNGQSVQRKLGSVYPICRQNAEWIVEDYNDGLGKQLPLANFTTITFHDAIAIGTGGTYTPTSDEAIIYDIRQNNHTLTSVSTDGSSVTITYV